jgi:aminopeptidase N
MEYPMATLINGPGLGTVFHEWMHTWYQGMLGTNESLYPWMDEGFTEWASGKVSNYYREAVIRKRFANEPLSLHRMDSMDNILPKLYAENYAGYFFLVKSDLEEPLSTHSDHYETNTGYSASSYSKGCVFLSQLGYIVGDEMLGKIMLEYYRQWRFKHPDAEDFIHIAENVSGMKLDWYKEYWISTTKTIDYSIDSLWEEGGKTKIRLKDNGKMPMPVDVMIDYKDGTKEIAYIPMYLMFGVKENEDKLVPRTVFAEWKWTHPTYTFEVNKKLSAIKTIEIDKTQRMADVERRNNKLDIPW